jgi:hypothetical protein
VIGSPPRVGLAGPERDAQTALRTALIRASGSLSDERVLDPRVCDCCQTAAVRSDGRMLVAYRDRDDDERRDISILSREGTAWSAPRPLHPDGWQIEGCPVNGPALDAAGRRVVAAWYSGARDRERVHVAFSDDGGATFDAPIRVDLGFPLGRVDAALLPDGSALVTWIEGRDRNAEIRCRRVLRKGEPDPPYILSRTVGSRASGWPRMVQSNGIVVFAWTDPEKPTRVKTALLETGMASKR